MSRVDDRSRRRVARYVAARRGELGLSQEELAASAGIDPKTLIHVEKGKRWPLAKTRAKLEPALGWGQDDLVRIADGGYPVTGPLPEDDRGGAVASFSAGDMSEAELDANVRRVISGMPAEYRPFVEEIYARLQDVERQNRRLRSRIVQLPSRDVDDAAGVDGHEPDSQRLPNS